MISYGWKRVVKSVTITVEDLFQIGSRGRHWFKAYGNSSYLESKPHIRHRKEWLLIQRRHSIGTWIIAL